MATRKKTPVKKKAVKRLPTPEEIFSPSRGGKTVAGPTVKKLLDTTTKLLVWDSSKNEHVVIPLDQADKDKILYMLTTGRTPQVSNKMVNEVAGPVKSTDSKVGWLEANIRRSATQAHTLANLAVRLSEPIATLMGEKSMEPVPVIDITPENLLTSMDVVYDYNQRVLGILEEFVHRLNDMV